MSAQPESGFACIRQQSAAHNGHAALASMAQALGVGLGVDELRQLAPAAIEDLFGFLRTARRIGFSATALEGPYEELSGLALPIVLVCREPAASRFVVLHKIDGEEVRIADPARGLITLDRETLTREWTGD